MRTVGKNISAGRGMPSWNDLGRRWRFLCLLVSALLLASSFVHPRLPMEKPVFRYLFVIDITQSMNARDYHQQGLPADRLGFVKAAIRYAWERLPCGSEVGLALFTSRNSQLLFEPLEVCGHLPLLADVLGHVDWRMAWAADSHIARGLHTALRETAARGQETRLVFFSDGQQFPPEPHPPYFEGQPGGVSGLIIGVGGAQAVPIPKLDSDNQPVGFWEYVDLRDWLASEWMPQDSTAFYLARLDETALRGFALTTGLAYLRLETPQQLSANLLNPNWSSLKIVEVDLRWLSGLAALTLLLASTVFFLQGRGLSCSCKSCL